MNTDLEMRITARNKTSAAFADLRGELARTGASMSNVERNIQKVSNIVGLLPRAFNAAFAGISLTQIGRIVNDTVGEVAELYRQAKTAGVAFEDFQTLGIVAKKNQIDVASLGDGLREMEDKASEFAANGGGRAKEALERIGYTSKTTAEALQDPAEMFRDIIDKLGELDHASQVRFLGDIFGNAEGDKFLRLLTMSKDEIVAIEQASVDAGKVMKDSMGQAAIDIEAQFEDMRAGFDLWWKTAVVGTVQGLQGIGSGLSGQGFSYKRPGAGAMDPKGRGPGSFGALTQFANPGLDTSGFDVGGAFDILNNTDASRSYKTVAQMWKALTPPKEVGSGLHSLTSHLDAFDIKMSDTARRTLELTNAMRDGLTSAVTGFTDAILSGTNPLEAFEGLLGNLGKQLLNAGIQSLIGSLFPTTNVFAGSAFHGGWGAQGLPHFADGTMSAPAGLALVGERGPELVRFRGGEQVVPNGAFGGRGDVHFHIDARGAELGVETKIVNAIQAAVPSMIRAQAPAAVAAAQRNKVFG